MKKILSFSLLIFAATALFGQQDPQFTQFMYNKLGYNPGYAGSGDGTTVTALIRRQWMGLEGAPGAQLISFNMPLQKDNIGVGGTIWRNTIGISQTVNFEGNYAYRAKVGEGRLGLGVMGAVRHMSADFDMTDPVQDSDGAIPAGMQSKYVPNFGFGAYYTTDKYFFGASIPRLLENNIDFADDETVLTREIRHFYFMGGGLFRLSETTQLQPQALFKYVSGAPFDADLNLNLILMNKYMVGVSYRTGGSSTTGIGESIDFLLAAHLNENLVVGFGYDVTMSEIRTYQNGTIEAMVRYNIKKENKNGESEYLNPRFF